MKLQPVERVPYYNTLEAIRIRPFVAVTNCIIQYCHKAAEQHQIIISSQQELVIPAKEWTATEISDLNPVSYLTRELNRIFGFDMPLETNMIYYFHLEVIRTLSKSLFYPTFKIPHAIKLYELVN